MTSSAIAFAMDPLRTRHVLTPDAIERLGKFGEILDTSPFTDLDDDHARHLLSKVEILITGWGAPFIDAKALTLAPNLQMVAHAAGTVKGLIGNGIFDRRILVSHAAQANAVPVAEFTLAAIIFAGKNVFRFRDYYVHDRNRTRTRPLQSEPIGNHQRTIGIVGASRVGRLVMELLRPIGYKILLFDPYIKAVEAAALDAEKTDLETLMARADIVSLHAPSLPSTKHMINGHLLARMRDGATLINTARGALVDETALISALSTGRIDAIIDVTEPDIPPATSPLYTLPNVFLTPHIAGSIGLERSRLGELAVDECIRFIQGKPLLYGIREHELANIA